MQNSCYFENLNISFSQPGELTRRSDNDDTSNEGLGLENLGDFNTTFPEAKTLELSPQVVLMIFTFRTTFNKETENLND